MNELEERVDSGKGYLIHTKPSLGWFNVTNAEYPVRIKLTCQW